MIQKINLWKQRLGLWLGAQNCAEDSGVVWVWLWDTVKPGLCGCLCTRHAKAHQRATSVFLRCCPAGVLRQVLWLAWLDRAGLLASPSTGIISAFHHSWPFYVGSRGPIQVLILYFKHLINWALRLSWGVFSFCHFSRVLSSCQELTHVSLPTLYPSSLPSGNSTSTPLHIRSPKLPHAGVHNLLTVPHPAALLEMISQDL